MRIGTGSACLAVALAATPALSAAQDFASALAAYERRDYASAFHEWQALAEQGDARSQYRLGIMHGYGVGVEKSFKTARAWYEQAARQGNARAAYELGVLYELGRGVWQDERQAARWFQQGALGGYGPAQDKFERYRGFLR